MGLADICYHRLLERQSERIGREMQLRLFLCLDAGIGIVLSRVCMKQSVLGSAGTSHRALSFVPTKINIVT
jgi:hypothetical protein